MLTERRSAAFKTDLDGALRGSADPETVGSVGSNCDNYINAMTKALILLFKAEPVRNLGPENASAI